MNCGFIQREKFLRQFRIISQKVKNGTVHEFHELTRIKKRDCPRIARIITNSSISRICRGKAPRINEGVLFPDTQFVKIRVISGQPLYLVL